MKKKLIVTLATIVLIFHTAPGLSMAEGTPNNIAFSTLNSGVAESTPINFEVEVMAGGALIFFGGIVVGMVANGVISYTTGYSGDMWVEKGLAGMEAKIRSLARTGNPDHDIYVRSDGTIGSHCTIPPCRGYDRVDPK